MPNPYVRKTYWEACDHTHKQKEYVDNMRNDVESWITNMPPNMVDKRRSGPISEYGEQKLS